MVFSMFALAFVLRPLPRGSRGGAVRMAEEPPTIKVPDVTEVAANVTAMLKTASKDFDFEAKTTVVRAKAKAQALTLKDDLEQLVARTKELKPEEVKAALLAAVDKAKDLKPEEVKAAVLAAVEKVQWAELKEQAMTKMQALQQGELKIQALQRSELKAQWAELQAKAAPKIEAFKQSEEWVELEAKVAGNLEALNDALEPLMKKKDAFLEENEEQIAGLRIKSAELYEAGSEKAREAMLAAKAKVKEFKDEA